MGWLVSLSPWVQVPLILAAALPVGGVVAWVIAWVVVKVADAVAGGVGKQGVDAQGDSRR